MLLTVAEAKQKKVCRICEKPMDAPAGGSPVGCEENFGAMVYPMGITYNFGKEFAHTECLAERAKETEKKKNERVWTGWHRPVCEVVYELKGCSPPSSKILLLPPGDGSNVREIISEIPRNSNRLDQSVALVMLGRSDPHFHKTMVEVYVVLRGKVRVWLNDEPYDLGRDDHLVIRPNVRHWAEAIGADAIVKVICSPPWTPADHHHVT